MRNDSRLWLAIGVVLLALVGAAVWSEVQWRGAHGSPAHKRKGKPAVTAPANPSPPASPGTQPSQPAGDGTTDGILVG
jgi:hypothetical protein